MKPSIDELFDDDQYIKLAELPYAEIIPFVQHELAQRNGIIRSYIWLNILILLAMLAFGTQQVWSGHIRFFQLMSNVFIGFGITFTILVPVHEAIHGIAYKLLGAPSVAFGGNVRQFYFYAVADRFVVEQKGFRFLALAPFAVISALMMIGILLTPLPIQWILWGILLLHTGACAGDFGMLGFYYRHSGGEIFTFDDVNNKIAYFFQKR